METDRKHKREWGVYDQEKNQFYNMDCTSILEDQHFEETPQKGCTYEEAQRFMVHCDNKPSCKIVNIKQPKYLLNFELQFYRKEQTAKEAKENMRYINNIQQVQTESNIKSKNKQNFFTALGKYMAEAKKPMDSVQAKELLQRKPKIEDYGLSSNDFNAQEKRNLQNYQVSI